MTTFHRFYLPRSAVQKGGLVLNGAEAHHCHDVLRLGEGAKVVVFDGEGRERLCKIETSSPKQITLSEIHASATPALPFKIALAQAIPKGKMIETILQKATELSAHRIIPVISERTVVKIGKEADDGADAGKKRERWREIVIEAAKQSGNNWLPEVDEPRSVRDAAAEIKNFELAVVGSLQPGARFLKTYLDEFVAEKGRPPASILAYIGPEGDYTPAELSHLLGAGCRPITLGQIVLRSETAAIYVLSTIAYELQTRSNRL